MKTIKIILASFLVLAFLGCDQEDNINTIYDTEGGQALVSFDRTGSNLPVLIDDTGSVDVYINVTTSSTSARTIGISIDEENSTADTENYSLSTTSVTVPAGAFQGVVTINGVDNSIEPASETIVLNIDSFSGDLGVINNASHTVSIFQICPVPSTYLVGTYTIVDSNANLSSNETVTISVSEDDSTVREFVTTFLPGSTVERPTRIMLALVCGSFALQEVDENLTCTQAAPFALDGAGAQNSAFSLDYDDDNVGDVHTVNYIEDSYGDCGAPSLQNFTLTKQ